MTTKAPTSGGDSKAEAIPKPVPTPTPETETYWDATRRHELRLQQCNSCNKHYFYPREFCPHCASDSVEWVRSSGRATLYSYVIEHRPAPGFADEVPYVVAIVELEEGPRMMTNIVGVEPDPEQLVLDMPLTVAFEPRGEVSVP